MNAQSIEKHPPLLKWPGGKRALLKHISPLIPTAFNKYYEPFVGGGAVFFNLNPKEAILSDRNSDLINCYVQVRDNPIDLIESLNTLQNSKEDYYKIRGALPKSKIERAARFLYLATLCFNGIYRQNLKGEFNVPYGYKTHLKPCDEERILAISTALSSTELYCRDFSTSLRTAQKGDLVYLDPPYTVAHSNNGFVKYNAKIFSWADQIRLSEVAKRLVKRGCAVIISNADHYTIDALYPDFEKKKIDRLSVIAASEKFRGQITESIFFNVPDV